VSGAFAPRHDDGTFTSTHEHGPWQPASRPRLEAALADLHAPWLDGPHGESARELLVRNVDLFRALLVRFDRLTPMVAAAERTVITHGEPHPDNVMWTDSQGVYFIDWDTVGLALPEGDLWLLVSGVDDEFAVYETLTDTRVDSAAPESYRLRWWLDEAGLCASLLRSAHAATEDAAYALHALDITLTRAATDQRS
jgi:spectinomycin phosphotransferase